MQINRITKKDNRIVKSHIKDKKPVYHVRIDQDVYEQLTVEAAKNSRSISKEINYRLKQSLMIK